MVDRKDLAQVEPIVAQWIRERGTMMDGASYAAALELAAYVAARRTTPDRECEWKCDDIDNGIWESACGESWSFIDGGPVENRMLFCHRCGGKLKTAPTSDKGGA
ncbi:hypothetical protein [Burkholderia cepacia]|uniref:hypothetical protein n=1 Tax=Burkholderia cepacia TaxID=292 RepID=UPI001F27045E|nr:hypothetical protein [Burkholderia cepacia]MCE4125808.1 hypothetical protein [Burkholderia cepacia]